MQLRTAIYQNSDTATAACRLLLGGSRPRQLPTKKSGSIIITTTPMFSDLSQGSIHREPKGKAGTSRSPGLGSLHPCAPSQPCLRASGRLSPCAGCSPLLLRLSSEFAPDCLSTPVKGALAPYEVVLLYILQHLREGGARRRGMPMKNAYLFSSKSNTSTLILFFILLVSRL